MMGLMDAAFGISLVGLAAASAWGALSDLTRYRIPNRVCLLLAGLYPLALAGLSPLAWAAGLGVGAAAFVIGLGLYARGWLGGGDVKFAAAIALWAGPALIAGFALTVSIAALGLSLLILSPLRRAMPRPPQDVAAEYRQAVPFGVPLAVGGVWIALQHMSVIL